MADLLHFERQAGRSVASPFDAIEPVLELHKVPLEQRYPHVLPDGTCAWSITDAVNWSAMRIDRDPRTIQRWVARFNAKGASAFGQCARADKGTSRFFNRHNEAAVFAAYLYVALKPSVRVVHEAILRNRELIALPTNVPSIETVRVWLRSSPALVASALEGQRKYRELMFSDIERGFLAARKDRSE